MTLAAPRAVPGFLVEEGVRLLLFGGKGGVGKTTCAAAAALHLATTHPSRAYLLVSTDPAHSLLDCVAGEAVPQNLMLREIDPQASLARFRARHHQHIRTIVLRGTFFDEADITQLLDLSVPGLDEIMALLEIVAWVKDEQYACIVVDTAPAGHTLRLLELPELLRKWLGVLDLMSAKHRFIAKLFSKTQTYTKDAADRYLEETAADLTALWTVLRSPTACRFVPVLLAEALSVHITHQMVASLASLGIAVREMVVNRLLLHPPLADCPVCLARLATQAAALVDIARTFPGYECWGVPLFLQEVRGTARLGTVCAHLRPLVAPAPAVPAARELGAPPAVENPAGEPAAALRLLLFAGKGGVGKTTLACATALWLAERWPDKKILLFSIDAAHSLSPCLQQQIGANEVPVTRGLRAIELDAKAEYACFKQHYADEVAEIFEGLSAQASGIQLEFDQEVMEHLLDTAPPGLDEMIAITRIMGLLEEGRYDLFILDTAPTGHLLRFLEMPELMQAWLRTFFNVLLKYRKIVRLPKVTAAMVDLSKKIKGVRRILADPTQAMLMAVTIPTVMAYEETVDLVAACERLHVALGGLFVNMVTPENACPTCTALRRGEAECLENYRVTFPRQALTTVYRQGAVVRETLHALGQAMYADGGGRAHSAIIHEQRGRR